MLKFGRLMLALSLASLQGCSYYKSQWLDRYGPDPILAQNTTADAANRQLGVVNAVLYASGHLEKDSDGKYVTTGLKNSQDWYGVILTGFNVIDDACQVYMNDLWKINREKNRVKDVLTATGVAASAIISANANPSATTMNVLAQSLGLASSLTSAIGDSYLFAQDPAAVAQIVKKLQVAYRTDLANNLDTKGYPIASYSAVYFHMREYLSLCLPPTIEAQVQDLIAKAKAGAQKPPGLPVTSLTARSTGRPTKATTEVSLSPGS